MKCSLCLAVENETSDRIKKLESGTALVSFNQAYEGWSILVFKNHVEDIRELTESEQMIFWNDIKKLATAIEKAFAPDKLNYAVLMNKELHLHCHIIPRYRNDPNWGRSPWPIEDKSIQNAPAEQSAIAEKIRQFL